MTQKSNGGSASRSVTKAVKLLGPDRTEPRSTLLAVCPISPAIVDANLTAAARAGTPAIFTATLNQVDIDCGYTGWSSETFVKFTRERRDLLAPSTQVIFCLDHGGPWKKDDHASQKWSFSQTWTSVKHSIEACIRAGYVWLHIDTTVDPEHGSGALATGMMAERAAELVAFAEDVRQDVQAPQIVYETGIEESRGGGNVTERLDHFLHALNVRLRAEDLPAPSFAVCDLGTRLDGSTLDVNRARSAVEVARHHGALVKAHYSDDLATPDVYPNLGIAAANVGPGLAAQELAILNHLQNACVQQGRKVEFVETVFRTLDQGGRWRKWLPDGENAADLSDLPEPTRRWLLRTGARYVLQSEEVLTARARLAAVAADCLETDIEANVRKHLAVELDRLYRDFNLVGFERRIEAEE